MNSARLVNHQDPNPSAWPPVWKLWENPILRRYCRSRLRTRGLGIWILITVLVAGFIFFISRESSLYRGRMDLVDAERMALIPLLILQGIILFLLGTGQVAGGMTAEADEGVLDYQRLAPMSAFSKVIGYLFGLPIREYVLFAVTLPFSFWALWRGEVPLGIAVQLYAAVFCSAILYHLTGLVAGTVVKNRRWAFLVSMAVVFLLYTVIPQLANFGLVYFKYLTIMPVLEECYPHMVQRNFGAGALALQNLLPSAKFFNLDFPQLVFTLMSQTALILTGLVMLWRRWTRSESHLLGKAWATGLFAWIQLVLLGNALPLIEPGHIFPSRGLDRFTGRFRVTDWYPDRAEALAMTVLFGAVTLAMIWIMTIMITPNEESRMRGWRRARKIGHRGLSPFSDPATAFPWVLLMVLMGTLGWSIFAKAIIEAHWFPGQNLADYAFWAFLLLLTTGGMGFHAILEGRGGRATGFVVILIGVLPIMIGSIVAIMDDRFAAPATWLFGISPAASPMLASFVVSPMVEAPSALLRAVPRAFWFWQAIAALLTLRFMINLRKSLRATAQKAEMETRDAKSGTRE